MIAVATHIANVDLISELKVCPSRIKLYSVVAI
jgi:hypothetical protein